MAGRVLDLTQSNALDHTTRWKLLCPFLTAFGRGCLAYSTLQQGMEYFIDEEKGYIAYSTFRHPLLTLRGRKMVLGAPIADARDYAALLKEFLCDEKHAIFLQISQRCAEVLSGFSIQVNEFGVEHTIDLKEFSMSGKSKGQLRHWINKARKEQVQVYEEPIAQANAHDIEEVCKEWLRRKGGEEARILTRPLLVANEKDVRYFFVRKDRKMLGIVGFDPIYENNRIAGYYHNIVRMVRSAPNGSADLATVHAFDVFRNEGVGFVSLGLSPLCLIEDARFPHSRSLSGVFKFMYNKCNHIYPFQGNHFHKRKYDARLDKVYFASTRKNSPWEVLITLKALNLPLFPSRCNSIGRRENEQRCEIDTEAALSDNIVTVVSRR